MKRQHLNRLVQWLGCLLLIAVCVLIFQAWLSTANTMSLLQLLSFCA
jgi:hypothetical protein